MSASATTALPWLWLRHGLRFIAVGRQASAAECPMTATGPSPARS
ncbi:hypothetical protein [[Mycobacterium] burgundiense]|uniref:Uncharacterized protein n=1 Tax=[Mycobacterium] burgundiense TaxID=3064286 RepID=A0ABN9NTL0_9MYCO|nr:hypothetical protein [Mycolicibacterium sp. MU0053]CAJ1511111.1 hypothetical protein MU0053_005028 [Mycolicibacterium sp. MU0053]